MQSSRINLSLSLPLVLRITMIGTIGLLVASQLIGCTGGTHKEPNVDLIQDMMDQPALKPQDYEPFDKTKAGSRTPPKGTVPRDFKPYAYAGDPDGAAKNLKNPIANDSSPQILSIGQAKYETYCMVCHGQKGLGDGPVASKMSIRKPPSLLSEKIRNLSDGGIYHIITDGQGLKVSYYPQIPNEKDRWAMVNYIRSLQKFAKGQ